MRSNSAPPVLQSPKKRLKWTSECMVRAMDAVKRGSSMKRAAEQHGVPRTTLRDRISGRAEHEKKPGPEPYLNREEEEDLVNFIEEVAEVGYGRTRKQIKAMVEQTAREKQVLRKQKISDGWFRRFLERQPHLCLRKGDCAAAVRMEAMKNKAALDNYFILLKSILDDYNLGTKPGQIYNMDETGIPLDHRSPRVLAKKGQKKVRYCSTGNKSQVTVVGCINAVGQALPPFVVFDAKNLNMQWCVDEVPGTTYGLSDNGWMDMKLFKGWFIKHFLNLVGSARPVLLLMDGHSSHYNLEAVNLAKESDVILFTLVPHTTHEMQPLFGSVTGKPTVTFCPINYCDFTCCEASNGYYHLSPVRDNQCRSHRSGTACGSCTDGYTLSFDSTECVNVDSCTAVLVILLTVTYWIVMVTLVFAMMYYKVPIGYLYSITYYYSIVDIIFVCYIQDLPWHLCPPESSNYTWLQPCLQYSMV